MNMEDTKQYRKGMIGQEIVKSILQQKGYVVYETKTKAPHAFDFMAIKDKREVLIAEVKTKARLNNWNATGIDIKHFDDYMFFYKEYGIDVILYFVDEHPEERRVYCHKLRHLIQPVI